MKKIIYIIWLLSSSLGAAELCEGPGKWEFGTKTVGPLEDPKYPFIEGRVPGQCSLNEAEIALMKEKLFVPVPNVAAAQQKIAIFTMAAPGCGKSSSLDKLLELLNIQKTNIVLIDPDDLRSMLSDFKAVTNIPSEICPGKFRAYADAVKFCLSAGRDARNILLREALISQKHFIFDSPCSDANFCVQQMQEAARNGFRVYALGVYSPVDSCVLRAQQRALYTGRYTEEQFVRNIHREIEGKFMLLANAAIKSGGSAYIFDNSHEEPKLIFEKKQENDTCDKSQAACVYFTGK